MRKTKTAAAEYKQAELNEKASYPTKCAMWQSLKKREDISTLAQLAGVSKVTISIAVNHGTGSLRILRMVRDYFDQRAIATKTHKHANSNVN